MIRSLVVVLSILVLAAPLSAAMRANETALFLMVSDTRVIAQLNRAATLGYRLESVTSEAGAAGATVHKFFYLSTKPDDGTVGAFDTTVTVKQGKPAVTAVTRFLTFQ